MISGVANASSKVVCHHCKTELPCWTNMSGNKNTPADGDITICLTCCNAGQFVVKDGEVIGLTDLSEKAMMMIAGDPAFLKAMESLRLAKAALEKKA